MKYDNRPSCPPSFADWETFRPVILRLYIEEKKGLQEVQAILLEKHAFQASLRTFKNKLRQWKVRKNYSQSDIVSNGHWVNNKSTIPLSKAPVTSSQPNTDIVCLTLAQVHKFARAGPQQAVLHNEVYNTVHSILLSTQEFATFTISHEAQQSINATFRRNKGYMWSSVQQGLTMLECDAIAKGFENLQQGCSMAPSLLRHPPKHFLLSLFTIMGSNKWARHENLRQSLLEFLASISTNILGEQHPVTRVLQHVRVLGIVTNHAEAVFRVMLDLYEKKLGIAHEEVLFIKQGLSIELMRQNEYSKSENVILEAWNASSLHHGAYSAPTRRCMRRLGNLYFQQGRLLDAEAVFEEVISRDKTSSSSPDDLSIITCQNLSMVSAWKEDMVKSEYWADKELEMALQRWGLEDEYYLGCCERRTARRKGAPPMQWFSWLEIT